MEHLDIRRARRLALARAGLLKREWTGLPGRASGRGKRARSAALALVERFGYLQLDTVSVAGARSHSLVLLSRFEGMDRDLGEDLLNPKAYGGDCPLFEYWGHEACWMPIDLYPAFGFRRESMRRHPWVAPHLDENPDLATAILERARDEGAFRSADLEGSGSGAWWGFKLTKKVATSLWSTGDLAIRERRAFQRTFDLPDRVIPESHRDADLALIDSLERLLLKALDGHGWATTATLADTWRLRNLRPEIHDALERLRERGEIVPCRLDRGKRSAPIEGWIRPADLELAERLASVRPGSSRGLLLSPFDPVLWDRERVRLLFGFDQVLEIFKPEPQRVFGYFCLPVLAGEKLVGRVDLKAHRREGRLEVRSRHAEPKVAEALSRRATDEALARHAEAVGLALG